MANTSNHLQRRIINYFIRRNLQGWGKPLAFTIQRLRLGGSLLAVALVSLGLDLVLNGAQQALHLANALAVLLILVTALSFIVGTSFWVRALPQYLMARGRQPEEHQGTVNAIICDAEQRAAFTHDHFITLREADGQLRAFAIDPALHDQICRVGKRVTLLVIPGIDFVTGVK